MSERLSHLALCAPYPFEFSHIKVMQVVLGCLSVLPLVMMT